MPKCADAAIYVEKSVISKPSNYPQVFISKETLNRRFFKGSLEFTRYIRYKRRNLRFVTAPLHIAHLTGIGQTAL